jgi:hypothetical protein
MTPNELNALANRAEYVGSSQHKDVPAMGLVPRPRQGAIRVEDAGGIDNPDRQS